jgi:hypothetical protein
MTETKVGSDALTFLRRLLDLGTLQGTSTTSQVNPVLRPLVNAFYQVLAGGEVRVEMVYEGDQKTFEELQRLEIKCIAAVNEFVTTRTQKTDIM